MSSHVPVYQQDYSKTNDRIFMKFHRMVGRVIQKPIIQTLTQGQGHEQSKVKMILCKQLRSKLL